MQNPRFSPARGGNVRRTKGAPQLDEPHLTTRSTSQHCANRHKAPPSPVLSNVNRRGADVLHQLFDRGFTWIVASEAVVDIGVLARVAAQSWVAYDLTGSSLWVGAVAAFRAIPSFLSPAVAAYIGNHVNHRILVAAMRACIGILAIIQAILIGTGAMRPWHQAVLTLFTGLAIAFAWPSFVTFLNDIVQPRMATRANAVLSYSHNLGELIGPIAVGIIIALVGADWSFVFIAIGSTIGGAIAHFTTNETALFTSAIASIILPIIAYIASPAFRRA